MTERKVLQKKLRNKSERGSSIVESVICMLLLCLILFGLLQIFLLFTTQEFNDYSAFRGARSAAVGFNDQLVRNESIVKNIPVSGRLVYPDDFADSSSGSFNLEDSAYARYYRERQAIRHFMEGDRYLIYEYWTPEENDYKTELHVERSVSGNLVRAGVSFDNYPLRMPFAKAFLSNQSMDVASECELADHAKKYLED